MWAGGDPVLLLRNPSTWHANAALWLCPPALIYSPARSGLCAVLQELLPAFADIHPTENRYARMVRAGWCLCALRHDCAILEDSPPTNVPQQAAHDDEMVGCTYCATLPLPPNSTHP